MANAHWEAQDFALPTLDHARWCRFVDTVLPGDDAIMEAGELQPLLVPHRYLVESRSVVVLIAEDGDN